MDVVLRAHSVRGESHIQSNANGEVATVPYRVVTLRMGCVLQQVIEAGGDVPL